MEQGPSLGAGLIGLVGVVLFYYLGTRGITLMTRRHAGRWYRRLLVSLSFAVLFAPSLAGVGHGGVMPAPAWMVGLMYATENAGIGVWEWGMVPILATWAVFFAVASITALMSKHKNNKVDTNGKES